MTWRHLLPGMWLAAIYSGIMHRVGLRLAKRLVVVVCLLRAGLTSAQTCPCPAQSGINYRSVGVGGILANIGNASVPLGGTTVTFSVALPASIGQGDELRFIGPPAETAIGRLPAANVDHVRVMVEKILEYETWASSTSTKPMLVADDPDDAGDFEGNADAIATAFFDPSRTRKIYLSGMDPDAARVAILDALDEGASTLSYFGHGAIHLWADEHVFDIDDVTSLSGQSQQPLLFTMSCLNGYFHFPYLDSLAEAMVRADGRGAIAAFSPSGLSVNDAAYRYHRALLGQILSAGHERLGDAVVAAQADYLETGELPELFTIYHLFGDPALRLR